ncbi:hypothetical protein ONS95_005186 [Cadophora gregata]|uniref:uncharacterized protein n=1 Tax=Cadophora gregata TaxID=51156 RepID=UPI0026DD41D7|nr:uncharacterized protein ONS95_005186 [Cadophora gregata]KAK0104923.1 hypothetical protein ONS95_005186 [Cadophora gregata]KAK0114995.1 hypothetical protein ONS96_013469 [Cadophora gregata f. sp. sojae]
MDHKVGETDLDNNGGAGIEPLDPSITNHGITVSDGQVRDRLTSTTPSVCSGHRSIRKPVGKPRTRKLSDNGTTTDQSTTTSGKKTISLEERDDWGVEKFRMNEDELGQIRREYHLIRFKFFIGKTEDGKDKGPDHTDYLTVTNDEVRQFLELRRKNGGYVSTPRYEKSEKSAAANLAATMRMENKLER